MSLRASASWSAQIAQRYRCVMPESFQDWWDSEIWRHSGTGEFRAPVHPEALLQAAPEVIWPGLMVCDLIPIISNNAGDWLCARIDRRGNTNQIVHWYHGGGDWIPWGDSLAQAIVFDAVVPRISTVPRRHAFPAEDPREGASVHDAKDDPLVAWALTHLPDEIHRLIHHSVSDQDVPAILLAENVAEVAVRCEQVVANLVEPARNTIEHLHALGHSIDRESEMEWSFDLDRIDPVARQRFTNAGFVQQTAQDWTSAEHHCCRVVEVAPDLAWAWELRGYIAERRSEIDQAIAHYQRATECSVFSDQSVRLQTHWMSKSSAKFSAGRLAIIAPELVNESPYLQLLVSSQTNQRRPQVMQYWTQRAESFAEQERWDDALESYLAAGWDLGAEPIHAFANVLDRVAETADLAGQPARAELARTHRRCLRERYGI